MKIQDQIKEEFTEKLKALISEYGEDAELEAKDYYEGYPECGQDVHMTLIVPGKWDEEGNVTQKYCEINLGSWISPE